MNSVVVEQPRQVGVLPVFCEQPFGKANGKLSCRQFAGVGPRQSPPVRPFQCRFFLCWSERAIRCRSRPSPGCGPCTSCCRCHPIQPVRGMPRPARRGPLKGLLDCAVAGVAGNPALIVLVTFVSLRRFRWPAPGLRMGPAARRSSPLLQQRGIVRQPARPALLCETSATAVHAVPVQRARCPTPSKSAFRASVVPVVDTRDDGAGRIDPERTGPRRGTGLMAETFEQSLLGEFKQTRNAAPQRKTSAPSK